jgi:sugar phosphate isomerase/epimerase
MKTVLPCRLTISSLTLRKAPFARRVQAAAAAGFEGVGLSVEDYLAARDEGLDDRAMHTILDDHAVAVTEVEFLSDWLPHTEKTPSSPREITAFHIARAFEADHLNVGLFEKAPLDLMADSFTALCERADDLKIALEYMPFSGVPDLGTAWELARHANRYNAGLIIDVWHWARGSTRPSDLAPVPAERIFAVQLCDVSSEPLADMRHESLHYRLPPGSRTKYAQDLMTILAHHGVAAELSAEVMSDALLSTGFEATAKTVFTGAANVITEQNWCSKP